MAYIEWSDALSVQIREIDAQHKQLIDIINRLHQAMIDKKGKELQKEIISEMHDYAASHFMLEERYMRRYSFPDLEDHCREHGRFAQEVAGLKARADSGGLILSIVILALLKEWLKNHILGTDMKYVEHFKRFGLA